MLIGVVFALLACFVWGMIYVIPTFLVGYNAIEITFMRYVFYGGISSFLLLVNAKKIFKKYSLRLWMVAFLLALIGHVLYYLLTVIALRLASPPVTVLIAGLIPLVIAFYGNWEMKECHFSSLIIPSIAVLIGLVLVNFSEISGLFEIETPEEYFFGLFCAFLALLFWSWYAVKNGLVLKSRTSIDHSDWATIMGVGTLFWILIFFGVIAIGWHEKIDWHKYITPSKSLGLFLIGTFFLGTLCSWGGVFFWNRASAYLPLSVAGPMIIFETLFGLSFVYLVQQKVPSLLELIGAVSMLLGIAYILITLRKSRIEP